MVFDALFSGGKSKKDFFISFLLNFRAFAIPFRCQIIYFYKSKLERNTLDFVEEQPSCFKTDPEQNTLEKECTNLSY